MVFRSVHVDPQVDEAIVAFAERPEMAKGAAFRLVLYAGLAQLDAGALLPPARDVVPALRNVDLLLESRSADAAGGHCQLGHRVAGRDFRRPTGHCEFDLSPSATPPAVSSSPLRSMALNAGRGRGPAGSFWPNKTGFWTLDLVLDRKVLLCS